MTSFKFIRLCLLYCVFLNDIKAQSKNINFSANIAQYEVFELEYELQKNKQVLAESTVAVQFIHESGYSFTALGFINKNKYLVRFCPEKQGKWRFYTLSNNLDWLIKKGELIVNEPLALNKGGITIDSKNPQKFQYQNGQSYFPLAFECDWLWALDYGRGNLNRTDSLLNTIVKNGFNQVVMNVYAYDVGWKVAENVPSQYEFKRPQYSVFENGNDKPRFDKLNYNFLEHYDNVIKLLQKKGLVAHIMIYVWNKKVNWPSMYSQADNAYFDHIINRYQAFSNVIWDISKEALDYGRCDIPYINERIARIRKNDQYGRLVTVHDYEYCSREPQKVDFISIQNWRSELHSQSLASVLKHSNKPVYNIEHGGYEEGPFLSFQGNYVSPEACIIRNYECAFAGAYTSYYWQNTSWNIVIWDIEHNNSIANKPRLDYYKHFTDFFYKYNYQTLKPSIAKNTTNGRVGADNLASSGLAMSNEKDLFIYFVPAANFQTNVVLPEGPEKLQQATWFNPFTGQYLENKEEQGYIWKSYQNPWKNQAAILIVKTK